MRLELVRLDPVPNQPQAATPPTILEATVPNPRALRKSPRSSQFNVVVSTHSFVGRSRARSALRLSSPEAGSCGDGGNCSKTRRDLSEEHLVTCAGWHKAEQRRLVAGVIHEVEADNFAPAASLLP